MNRSGYAHIAITAICLLVSPRMFGHDANIPDKAGAIGFLHQIQAALKANQPNQVAPLMHYPLRTTVNGKSTSIRSKAEFIQNYGRIFTRARVKAILACEDGDVWYRDQGYSIPYGVIWFDDFAPASPHTRVSRFEIMTVNEAMVEAK